MNGSEFQEIWRHFQYIEERLVALENRLDEVVSKIVETEVESQHLKRRLQNEKPASHTSLAASRRRRNHTLLRKLAQSRLARTQNYHKRNGNNLGKNRKTPRRAL
jgi:hypothetical protein